MKITICSGGTRGDVQPALALALALIEAGHDVLLAAPPENEAWAGQYHCPFAALSINVEEVTKDLGDRMTMGSLIRFMKMLRRGVVTQLSDFPPLVEGADLCIGISLVFALKSVAEHLGVPYLYLATSPQILPSSRHPTIATKRQNLPGFLNRLDAWASSHVNRLTWMGVVNRKRREWGLSKVRGSIWNYFLEPLCIVISDAELCPVPRDVTIPWKQTGFLPLRQQESLSKEVEDFLARGPAPVYVGFGSMPGRAEETSRLVLEAAKKSGQRMIIASGWARLVDLEPGEDHMVIGAQPHERLFPHLAAVVHHGGAGTTATAARAGAPQIIVPHYFDQFYWAERVKRSGIGPEGIPQEKLNAATLAEAITRVAGDPGYAEAARNLARVLNQKDALAETVRIIEAYCDRGGEA